MEITTNQPIAVLAANFATVDTLWVLIAAALVFFMQAGFKVLETGLVKAEHRPGIGVKNLMDWVAGSLAFFLIGFGLMFGTSGSGLIGLNFFLGDGFDDGYTLTFFIFQLAFAGTALTIVSGAMSGRTALLPYFITSLFTAVIIYPIFGHWAWGNLLDESNDPWLASMGFMDFAGSTVVHSVGAWVAFVGIYMVGPRLGRFSAKGKVQPVKASDYSYSILGVMILWLGWWGFNGGSTLAFNEDVVSIILNTNLAAAAAALSAYLHVKIFQKNADAIEKIIGGALTGLVAITACCNVVDPMMSIVIGLISGVIHNVAYVLIIEKFKLDDPVGAIPVHGFGGIFGTLCVAFFGKEELLAHPRWTQLGVQAFGILVCFVFTTSIAYVIFALVKATFGLRLSPKEEMEGSVFANVDTAQDLEDMPESSVSQVSVRISDKAYNLLSVKEYLNMPRETRLKLVRAEGVQYLDDYGNSVSPLKAVRYLAGVLEDQRDEAISEREIVEGVAYNEQSEVIGGMQDVLLGEEHSIVSVFPDSFVMLSAKGKVSADFYWHRKEKGYKIAVVASCMDKDIPNAFLSALTISLLNEIVGMKSVLPPEKILEYLDQKLILALEQSNKKINTSRGVEVGVFVLNTFNGKVYYSASGSRIKLYVKPKEGGLEEYLGLDIPLGKNTAGAKQFERQTISYEHGDAFYICTDGYANQINGSGKKFGAGRLKDKITGIAEKSMIQQKIAVGRELDEWMYGIPQEEDILIMGVKP
ncbi:ammonium transporter [Marinoscillum sp. MHG1-6]|uniref:ammonium transporter n=1 Tax=Marinoscillum sp. MHG1-6 TaxID=2959627 RepID=UPI002157E785|nr:ammonium transporter [Marinoscillum sp. MHG1-6]